MLTLTSLALCISFSFSIAWTFSAQKRINITKTSLSQPMQSHHKRAVRGQTKCIRPLKCFYERKEERWSIVVPWALILTSSSLRESTFSSNCLFFCSMFCRYSVRDLIFASYCRQKQKISQDLLTLKAYSLYSP